MTITIVLPQAVNGKVNYPTTITAQISATTQITNIQWIPAKPVNFTTSLDRKSIRFVPPYNGTFAFKCVVTAGAERREAVTYVNVGTVTPPTPQPGPGPAPVPGAVIYDSAIHSKLHNGIVRRITSEGNIECRASGNPYIQVNADGTFSLWDSDLGRFYLYVNNYDVMMELTMAFGPGNQTCSLKLRSRHNEGGDCSNRFGGYGFHFTKTSTGGKREPCHNNHDQSVNGSSVNLGTGIFHVVQFSVKDINGKPTEVGVIDGRRVWANTDNSPAPFMLNRALYGQRSYIWVRQNTSSLTELRIKRLRLIAI